MNVDEYRDNFHTFDKNKDLPKLCISVYKNNIIFTTKKIGSRFFEDISVIDKRPNSVDIDLQYNKKYEYDVSENSIITKSEFFSLLDISSFDELFSESFLKNYNLIFIIRDPLKRFFTGFVELIDWYYGFLMADRVSRWMFEKHFKINIGKKPYYNLRTDLKTESINKILNEFASIPDEKYLNDEHLSNWNTFVYNFINDLQITNKVKIIDLDDKKDMEFFPIKWQPSNKEILHNWLNRENNFYISQLMKFVEVKLSVDQLSYEKLTELKK
jgi:hypothetical protein